MTPTIDEGQGSRVPGPSWSGLLRLALLAALVAAAAAAAAPHPQVPQEVVQLEPSACVSADPRLPPGHPPVGGARGWPEGAARALPPGHPPIGPGMDLSRPAPPLDLSFDAPAVIDI
jgi:hypothetical protein